MDQNNNTAGTQSLAQPAPDQAPASQSPVAPQEAAPNPLAATPVVTIGSKPDASVPGATAGIPQPAPSSITPPPQAPTHASSPTQYKGKPMLWVIILLVFAFLCGLMLAVWYFQTQIQQVSPTEQTTQVSVIEQKKIVIGTDATFQPMEYTATGGAIMGYDIDLGNRIGEELGVEVEFKNIPKEDLFEALDTKQIDMILSSVVITEERKQQYDFSDSYLSSASNSAATKESYGIVFRKGDNNVVKVNEILNILRTQGILTNLEQKWLE